MCKSPLKTKPILETLKPEKCSIALNLKPTVQRIKEQCQVHRGPSNICWMIINEENDHRKRSVKETVKTTKQQSDTALSFWELFNTKIITKGLRVIDTGQNDRVPSNRGKMLDGIGPGLHFLRKISPSLDSGTTGWPDIYSTALTRQSALDLVHFKYNTFF